MTKQSELAKNTIIIAIGRLSTQLLSFLLLPLLTVYLSSRDYGSVDLVTSYITLITPIATISLDMAVFRLLIDSQSKIVINSIISTATLSVVGLSAIGVVFYIAIDRIATIPFGTLPLFVTLSVIFSNLFMQTMRGLGSNREYAISSIITGFLTTFFSIILIVGVQMRGEGILIATFLGNIGAIIYLLYIKGLAQYINVEFYKLETLKAMVKYSAPLVPNSASIWALSTASRTIVAFFMGVSATGILAVAYKIPSILSALSGIFGMAWTESASRYINRPERERDIFFSNALNYGLLAFMSLTLLVIAAVALLFDVIIGASFRDAYLYIPLLSIVAIFAFINQNFGAIYLALKKSNEVLKSTAISAITTIVITILLVPNIGLWGAALGSLTGYLVVVVYRYFDLSNYLSLQYGFRRLGALLIPYAVVIYAYYTEYTYAKIASLAAAVSIFIAINSNLIIKMLVKIQRKLSWK